MIDWLLERKFRKKSLLLSSKYVPHILYEVLPQDFALAVGKKNEGTGFSESKGKVHKI